VFVEKHSLRVLAVHLANRWRKYHLSDVEENIRTSQLVTNDTTQHVYLKALLVVAFDSYEDYHDPINGSFLKGSI
jgi:hypothetical protein